MLTETSVVTSTDTPPYSLDRLHHIAFVVADIDKAAAEFADLYGVTIVLFEEGPYNCRIDGADVSPLHRMGLSVGESPHIELLRAVPGSTVWTPVSGIHHIGFVVDNLKTASHALETAGSPIWMGGVKQGEFPVGATYHRDPMGQVVELMDRVTEARLTAQLERSQTSTIERP